MPERPKLVTWNGLVAERDAALARLAAVETAQEWRFVYENGACVSVSERVAHELARNAKGHIEVRSAWRPLAVLVADPAAEERSDG